MSGSILENSIKKKIIIEKVNDLTEEFNRLETPSKSELAIQKKITGNMLTYMQNNQRLQKRASELRILFAEKRRKSIFEMLKDEVLYFSYDFYLKIS